MKLPKGLEFGECTQSSFEDGKFDAEIYFKGTGMGCVGTHRNPIKAYEKAVAACLKDIKEGKAP